MTGIKDKKLSVVLWMPHGSNVPGGHLVQIESTAASLRLQGVDARISTDEHPDLGGCVLVHGFGLTAGEVHYVRSLGLPVVLSTIYWDRSYRADRSGGQINIRTLRRRAGLIVRSVRAAIHGPASFAEMCTRLLHEDLHFIAAYEAADLLLPNSVGESLSLQRDLGVTTACHIVPNAVDPDRIVKSEIHSGSTSSTRSGVLYVGRIDPHKNQLGLIRALRGTGIPLVIVGYDHPEQKEYARKCRAAGAGWVEFAPGTPDVGRYYQRARVHVTPSWFETTGLVSLEAALGGCNVVTTSRGHAKEYFGDLAWYCDPGSEKSIRNAVLAAYDAPVSPRLREHVLDNYTWDHTARATLAGYNKVANRCAHDQSHE